MQYGEREELTCIQPLMPPAAQEMTTFPVGTPVCIAYKVTQHMVLLPYAVHDDGYVLTSPGSETYFALSDADIAEAQHAGQLPTPMPAYELGLGTYVFGYSAWGLLALMIVVLLNRRRLRMRRTPGVPLTTTGPVIQRVGDAWLAQQVAPLLVPGERITHQAYGVSNRPTTFIEAATDKAYHVALTTRRLVLIQARIGAFGPLLENRGMGWIERERITGIAASGASAIDIYTAVGPPMHLIVTRTRTFSAVNQAAFLDDLPRLIPIAGPVVLAV